MDELKWLDEYSGQSTDELIALEGEYRTDSLVLAFEQAIDQKAARVGNDGLTDEERTILAVEALEREVNNGGYDQFFINSSKEFAPIIVDVLNRIGCAETAALTQEAIDALGVEGSLTVEAIDRVMGQESDQRHEKLNACDNTYYSVAGDLSELLLGFIKRNKERIITS
ncbi:MAG: DMP19 family protein [Planctomycetota bacterium]|jgi:hypothetical protein